MLVIRLARQGRTKYPVYRLVAAESSRAVGGKFISVLGTYNPHTKDLVLEKEEISRLIGNGAQPSNSVVKLLQREKMELPAWVKLKTKAPKAKDEPEVAEVEAAEADEAPAEEAPAAEEERVAEVATAEEAATDEEAVTPAEAATAEGQEEIAEKAEEAVEAPAEEADAKVEEAAEGK